MSGTRSALASKWWHVAGPQCQHHEGTRQLCVPPPSLAPVQATTAEHSVPSKGDVALKHLGAPQPAPGPGWGQETACPLCARMSPLWVPGLQRGRTQGPPSSPFPLFSAHSVRRREEVPMSAAAFIEDPLTVSLSPPAGQGRATVAARPRSPAGSLRRRPGLGLGVAPHPLLQLGAEVADQALCRANGAR